MSPIPKPHGKLKKVTLESVWPYEARDFTPWLAREENPRILGNTLVLELELEQQEVSVGPYSADILCKNNEDCNWIVIENQTKRQAMVISLNEGP